MADSTITTIEHLAAEKRAELERIEADLAALERTLAILRGTPIIPQPMPANHVEGSTIRDTTKGQQQAQNVVSSRVPEGSRRTTRQEPLQAIILRILGNAGHDMMPIEIDRAIRATGRTMHVNAVTSHLSRLWNEGRVEKTGPGRYAALKLEEQHEGIVGNGQLDWEGQQRSKEDVILPESSDVTYEERNPEEQNASPGISGEAF